MNRRLIDSIIADEIQSATSAGVSMLAVASKTSCFWLKQLIAIFTPGLLGGWLGWWLSGILNGTEGQIELFRSIISIIITLASVLSGFMVTLMLFTGRSTGSDLLPLDEAEQYVEKIKYLLFSQALTLVFSFVVMVFCILWLFLDSFSVCVLIQKSVIFLAFFFLFVIFFRVLLLPFQIYEIHEFELDAIVYQKEMEADASIK